MFHWNWSQNKHWVWTVRTILMQIMFYFEFISPSNEGLFVNVENSLP